MVSDNFPEKSIAICLLDRVIHDTCILGAPRDKQIDWVASPASQGLRRARREQNEDGVRDLVILAHLGLEPLTVA